jgi:cellulose synthase/poly-beta-1,6-N-acetylglucosamine synthase-like glycosyltransferase
MDWPVAYLLFVGTLAILPALLLCAQTWEFRRFVRSRTSFIKTDIPPARVTLFAPCKGLEHGLKENLRPLFEQDHPNYRLVLIVETEHDPACGPIRELLREYPHVGAHLIVSGVATTCGQKVHNLRVATAHLQDAEVLAFVDSDARPQPGWLRQLVQHLHRPGSAAATGYRWFVPERNTLPNLLLHSLNAAVASLVGPGKHHMVWGGAWAIRREVFETIALRDRWNGTLSDDLVAARELSLTGKKLEFEPGCMTASLVDVNWRQMFEFVRRQYTVARFYSPAWWKLGLLFCTVSQLAFWGGAVFAAMGFVLRAPWAMTVAVLPLVMYITYVLRASLRQNAAESFLSETGQSRLSLAAQFDIWCSPLAGLVNWGGMLGSLLHNQITWRGITYAIEPGGQVQILGRTETPVATRQMPFRKAG